MGEDDGFRLFAVAPGALLVEASHGEAARRFHDVEAVRVVALRAVHLSFDDWVMLREVELGVGIEMAGKAGVGIAPWVNDEFAPADSDMFAAGSMARFAAGVA